MDPSVPQDVKSDLALEAVTTMFAAWRVGTIRVDGISVEAPKENASFSLDSFTMTGWSNAGLDSLLLKNLEGSGPDGFLSLGSFELAGFVAPDLKALVKFAALEKDIDAAQHAEAIKETFAALPRLAHFGLHDVSPARARRTPARSRTSRWTSPTGTTIYAGATDIRLDGLSIPRRLLELDPQATEIFDTLGYDTLTLGMSLSDRWNPGRRHRRRDLDVLAEGRGGSGALLFADRTDDRLADAGDRRGRRKRGQEAAMMAMVSELGVASARSASPTARCSTAALGSRRRSRA